MADVGTPSAIDMSTSNTTPAVEKHHKAKPEKPDEEKYKTDLAKAEKEHAAAQERLNAIKAKLDVAKPNSKDSPSAKKQQELRAELASIRQQQSGFKTSRGSIQDKVNALDAQLKSRIAEQKTARSRVSFKNVDEVDREIQRLEKQVDAGTMKLVDEKKALAEITGLRKQRKGFAGFEEAQKGIDDVKGQIAELRKGMDNPEAKALSERYNAIAKELEDIKAEQDEAYKGISALRDERTKLHAEQQEKYSAMRDIKDHFHKARLAYRDYEQEQWRQRQERQKAERDAYQKEKRRKIADKKLEEASEPAYTDEILTAEGLIRYFDPSAPGALKVLRGPSGFAAEAQRTVDSSDIKGTRVSKKEDREENYFMGTGGKKGKKGKRSNAESPAPSTPTEGKFNLSIGVIEELAKVNVEPPMNQSDVPSVLEQLKAKLEHWKADQDKKTKENIEKAQKEIDRLESEAKESESSTLASSNNRRTRDSAKKPAIVNQSVNGDASADAELAQEKDAVADVTEDLRKASMEDKAA
ncbi:nuclear segregation protein [Lasallia pustulata]|uniref:Nuclear segregation protein n=1 Tax=Lasallia pustulata TaxID=136370 RepID=A0A1W5D2L4_9LECA|nr:nuclear segregation protein [Lasallia pustulata]